MVGNVLLYVNFLFIEECDLGGDGDLELESCVWWGCSFVFCNMLVLWVKVIWVVHVLLCGEIVLWLYVIFVGGCAFVGVCVLWVC